jgi:3-hydroxyisobutyrate dehydrogenase
VAAAKGKTFIDCPMSGGVVGAEKGTLTFMCGTTSEDDFKRIEPILLWMGKMAFDCKVVGGGQIAKACNNMALAIQMTSVSEALNLGNRLGLDPKVLSDIMCTATGRCWSVDTYNPVKGYIGGLPADRDFDNGFGIDLVIKDLTISTGAAAKVGANVEAGLMAKRKMEEMSAKGLGNKDFGYLYKWLSDQDAK